MSTVKERESQSVPEKPRPRLRHLYARYSRGFLWWRRDRDATVSLCGLETRRGGLSIYKGKATADICVVCVEIARQYGKRL